MKQERRYSLRQPTQATVRLYHPLLGCIRARIDEWSPQAVRLCGDIPRHNGHDLRVDHFQLEADSMDVIFTMQFVRLDEQCLVLSFVDEGELPAGDRL